MHREDSDEQTTAIQLHLYHNGTIQHCNTPPILPHSHTALQDALTPLKIDYTNRGFGRTCRNDSAAHTAAIQPRISQRVGITYRNDSA